MFLVISYFCKKAVRNRFISLWWLQERRKLKVRKDLFSFKILQDLCLFFVNNFCKYISFIVINDNHINIFVKKDLLLDFIFLLKHSMFIFCNQLLDITLIDRLENMWNGYRWEYLYVFLTTFYNKRIFVRGYFRMFDFLFSIIFLYKSANWLEREIWDMFGIFFKNHTDLRRILTDYNFIGSPLRKDFPLSGYVEVRYDESNKIIKIEPIVLMQELRAFRLENVWKK